MKRRYRLRGRKNFQNVRQQGQRWAHPLLVLGGLCNELDYSRHGFIVSRRLGPAVARNRVRRRLQEAVRLCQPSLEPGWDLVWIARPLLQQASFSQIKVAVKDLLHRAGLGLAGEDEGHA
ncbi:MAG: ribonuclease P protein component [Chloroflexia bacterium]|nr:ribonuclease P protein component [Chloroflexia bacterium]